MHSAEDATAFVRELFRQHGEAIDDLEVRRASLEDTYMALVREHEAGARDVRGAGVPRRRPDEPEDHGRCAPALARGLIELRQTFTNAQDLWGYLFPAVVLLVVMFFMRDAHGARHRRSRSARSTLPSVIGMSVAFGGLMSMAALLSIEREDGTLLRAKATPNGMLGYLVGKIVRGRRHVDRQPSC